jgi:hypothetical protein
MRANQEGENEKHFLKEQNQADVEEAKGIK